MTTKRLLIIGGSDAGISAGLRARELDPNCEVTILVADSFPNYSICGLPFYLSGEVPDWHALAHRTIDEITAAGIWLLLLAIVSKPGTDSYTAQRICHLAPQLTSRGASPVRTL